MLKAKEIIHTPLVSDHVSSLSLQRSDHRPLSFLLAAASHQQAQAITDRFVLPVTSARDRNPFLLCSQMPDISRCVLYMLPRGVLDNENPDTSMV